MLKLVLQTQEGQQIEITVSPDDTFEDLQKQYESPDNPGLPELLKHLITNGLDVDEKTRVFDYVTNSSSTEWLVEESLDDISRLETAEPLQAIIRDIPPKECCAKGCSNTEITTPEKVFFPLPSDKERLSAWLIGIGKPELLSMQVDSQYEGKHFVCADHFAPHQFLKGTNQALRRRACPSLMPMSTEEQGTNSSTNELEEICVKEELTDDVVETNEDLNVSDSMDPIYAIDFLEVLQEIDHPGVLCRLCGEHAISPVYLFSAENSSAGFSLADKINLCLPITVNAEDPLPKQVCKDCLDKLELCHKLAKRCLETEDKLTAMFKMKKFHVKDEEEKQCPLCVSGNMQTITKSGIYRKNKIGSIQESLKNSSARTRQVSPSRNVQSKMGTWSSSVDKMPHQEVTEVIPPTIVDEPLEEEEEVPLGSPPHLLPTEFLCSICCQKENSIENMIEHAKEHEGYPCTICKDVTFKTKNEQQVHFLKHGVNNGYCEICSIPWSEVENTAEHIKHCKPEFWDVECAQCGVKFPHIQAGHDHVCHEPEEWFECDQCGKRFSAKGSLNMHMKSHHKRETLFYKCLSCNKEFSRKGSLQKHITTYHEDVESSLSPKCYKCKKCNEAFSTSARAESHITDKHISHLIMAGMEYMSDQFTVEEINLTRVYMCEYCERCYTIPSSLHEHKQMEHSDNPDYQCNVCGNTFLSYKSLARHKTLHGKEYEIEDLGIKSYYICHYCNKPFLHFGTLRVHISQHQHDAPYLCRLCNFRFATYQEVTDHRKNAHPYQSLLHERPTSSFDCKFCEKRFSHEVALVKHIRMHTGEKPYKCSVCDKGFSQTSGLYTHLKVHSDLRPYVCPQCPQAFKIKGDRDNHVKKHSGKRPYKCEICDKAFMTQHVFSQHKKIHTNERPYKCDICGEAFRRSHVLTVHMRRHTGEKPHICDLCPKTYRQRGDLLKHKKMQHGIALNNPNNVATNSCTSLMPSRDISSAESTAAFLPL